MIVRDARSSVPRRAASPRSAGGLGDRSAADSVPMPGSPGRTTAGRRVAGGADHGCPTAHVPGPQTSADAASLPVVDLEEAGSVVPAAGPAGAVQLR